MTNTHSANGGHPDPRVNVLRRIQDILVEELAFNAEGDMPVDEVLQIFGILLTGYLRDFAPDKREATLFRFVAILSVLSDPNYDPRSR